MYKAKCTVDTSGKIHFSVQKQANKNKARLGTKVTFTIILLNTTTCMISLCTRSYIPSEK